MWQIRQWKRAMRFIIHKRGGFSVVLASNCLHHLGASRTSFTAFHACGPTHRRQEPFCEWMDESPLRCQAAVKESCQLGVVQTMTGETAGRQLLAERLSTQHQFLPRLFLCLCHALRPSLAKQRREPATPPGTASSLRGRNDDVDMSFDERALGGNLL